MKLKQICINIGIMAFFIAAYLILHEGTHYAIATGYSCHPTIGMDWQSMKEGAFMYVTAAECPAANMQGMLFAQAINEIVGYCILPFLMFGLLLKFYNM